MRITADVVLHARAFINPVKDRELDLRGLKIPLIENLGVTQDQFDTIDLSDNEIKRLDNFPRLKRLRTLLLSNNFVERLGTQLGEQVGELEALVLSNNKIKSLSEVDRLAALPKLATLSLVDNPVCKQPHYRAYVVHKLPALKVLDFKKVKLEERRQAGRLFKSAEGKQLEASVAEEGQALAAQQQAADERKLTDEQKKIAQEMIESATTPEELDRVERMIRAGIFRVPGKTAAAAPAPALAPAAAEPAPAPPAPAPAAPTPAKAPAKPPAQAPPPAAPAPAPQQEPPSPTRQSARQRSPSKRAREAAHGEQEEDGPAAKVQATAGEEERPQMEVEAPAPAPEAAAEPEAAGGGETLTAAEVDGMKVAELKAALKGRGLPQGGLKAELAERLKAHLAS